MNIDPATKGGRIVDAATVLARCVLGAVFVYMGLSKALHAVEFLKAVRAYEAVQNPFLLNAIAGGLPWFEVLCGTLLLAGVAVRGSALVLIAMLVPFTWMVLHRALALDAAIPFCAIKFDCGCGGGEVLVCRKLLENVVLILLSGWLLAGRGRRWCLRYRLI
jgi:uncharacterized membrane protein YphA (DoxX/SURF4 family)